MTRGVMTTSKLTAAIRKGFGRGRDELYQPWIRVRRHLHSKVSKLSTQHTNLYERAIHVLAGTERDSLAIALWLGAIEVREQRPMWPDPHEHPACGLLPELDRRYLPVRGLLDIAKELGVDHGTYVGTNIPFVATIDFTFSVGRWHDRQLIDWSVKPREILDTAPNRERIFERIAMERKYSQEVGSKHVLIDGTQWSELLADNVRDFRPLHSDYGDEGRRRLIEDFSAEFMHVADHETIIDALRRTAQRLKLSWNDANACFQAGAWFGHIDLDFTKPILTTQPMNRDAANTKHRLREQLFGVHE